MLLTLYTSDKLPHTFLHFTLPTLLESEILISVLALSRSSRSEVFCEKGILRNLAKFTRKQLCQSLSFNKFASLKPATLLKKRPWHRCFPENFPKFLKTPFYIEHL